MPNENTQLTLDEAVAEVMGLLSGLDLELVPEQDRYQAITRQINRAQRAVALDSEWSYFSSLENIGTANQGDRTVNLPSSLRPRIINDDAIRLVDPETGRVAVWAYWLPRDALHKYTGAELKAAHTRTNIEFSRPFFYGEDGLEIHLPVMREPRQFVLPKQPEDPDEELVPVDPEVRAQLVDFDYPDLVVRRAAYYYAQTNPLWQPRVQTLEANYKELMYALQERDERNTDSPYQNEWSMGIEGDPVHSVYRRHRPSADWAPFG